MMAALCVTPAMAAPENLSVVAERTPMAAIYLDNLYKPFPFKTPGDSLAAMTVRDYQGNPIPFSGASWSIAGSSTPMGMNEPFEAGRRYALTVPVDLSAYQFGILYDDFADVTLYVNGDVETTDLMGIHSSGGQTWIRWEYVIPALADEPDISFYDVPSSAWYHDNVIEAVKLGLVNGKGNGRFDPNANMTFAEAAKLAACMHERYVSGMVTLENSTDGSPWYKSYVDYCVKYDILSAEMSALRISGEAVMECANQPINRQEYVHIFAHALPEEVFTAVNSIPADSIPDVPLTMGAWSKYIYQFYKAGIINGADSKGTFYPEKNIKRCEVAAILVRMMEPGTRVGAPADLQFWHAAE